MGSSNLEEDQIDPALIQSIRNKMFFDRNREVPPRPPSQMTMKSGMTLGKGFQSQDIPKIQPGPNVQEPKKPIKGGPGAPVGLTSHTLKMLEKPTK